MNTSKLLGYPASLLVLATFCMSDMKALRLIAIGSNLAFIGPVLLLHLVLLPVNLLGPIQSKLPAGQKNCGLPMKRPAAIACTAAAAVQAPQRQWRRSLPTVKAG